MPDCRHTAMPANSARRRFPTLQRAGPRDHAIVARHPIRQDVVDAGALDRSQTAAGKLEWIALPEEVGGRTLRHRDRLARLAAAHGHALRSIHVEVAP